MDAKQESYFLIIYFLEKQKEISKKLLLEIGILGIKSIVFCEARFLVSHERYDVFVRN